jgi:hypothetical protein
MPLPLSSSLIHPLCLDPRNNARNPAKNPAKFNRNPWQDPVSPMMPPAIPIWANALLSVDQTPSRVVGRSKAYPFPDPGLFVAVETPQKRATYLENWLACRMAWVGRLVTRPAPLTTFPSIVAWRHFLVTLPDSVGEKTTATAKEKQEAFTFFGPEFIELQAAPNALDRVVHWQGSSYRVSDLASFPPQIIRQVLWEIYEGAFKVELSMLHFMLTQPADAQQVALRDTDLHGVFPGTYGQLLFQESLPATNQGLAADLRAALPYVEALRRVVVQWPGVPPVLLVPLQGHEADAAIAATYQHVAEFYCQSFFERFGRPPLVPHRLHDGHL